MLLVACSREQEAKEEALKQQLAAMRRGIAAFRAEHKRYPSTLSELVPVVPMDPLTGSSSTWKLVTEESVAVTEDFTTGTAATVAKPSIIDVKSGAPGRDRQGVPYSDY